MRQTRLEVRMIMAFGAWALAGCAFTGARSARAAQQETAAPAQMATAATAAAAQPELTVDQLLDNMEAVRKKIRTFKADVAKLRQAAGLDDAHFTGTIQFMAPRLLKLDLTSTEKGAETISFVGKTYGWVYRVREKQAERVQLSDIGKDEKAGNPLEYGLARDMHGLREGYTLKLLPREEVGDAMAIPLEMTPEGGETYAHGRLVFWIDTKTWLPVQVREYKSMGELVETHTFTHIVVNEPIRDSVFEFEPPKDVSVDIQETPEKARQ